MHLPHLIFIKLIEYIKQSFKNKHTKFSFNSRSHASSNYIVRGTCSILRSLHMFESIWNLILFMNVHNIYCKFHFLTQLLVRLLSFGYFTYLTKKTSNFLVNNLRKSHLHKRVKIEVLLPKRLSLIFNLLVFWPIFVAPIVSLIKWDGHIWRFLRICRNGNLVITTFMPLNYHFCCIPYES